MSTKPPDAGVMQWLATPAAQALAAKQPKKPDINSAVTQQIIDRFPEFATMLGIPEIADLLTKASQPGNNWSPAYFQEQLWNTQWWKDTPESSRTWQARKLVDPATAGEQSKTMAANVIGTANTLGVHLTPAEIAWYTEFAQGEGWDQAALTRAIVDTHKANQFKAGTIRSTQDSLHATAENYGLKVSDANAFHWAQQISAGRQTTDGFEDWARNQAKGAYPTLAAELEAGLTVKQVADPYLQIAAQTLGLNPESLSITDPKWQVPLQNRGADGKPAGPMNTLDWSRKIMQDPVYGYDQSANGRSASLQLRAALGKTFGVTT